MNITVCQPLAPPSSLGNKSGPQHWPSFSHGLSAREGWRGRMAVSLLLFCVEPHLSQHVLPARGVGSGSGGLEMGLRRRPSPSLRGRQVYEFKL